jgi:hypothetical protein
MTVCANHDISNCYHSNAAMRFNVYYEQCKLGSFPDTDLLVKESFKIL